MARQISCRGGELQHCNCCKDGSQLDSWIHDHIHDIHIHRTVQQISFRGGELQHCNGCKDGSQLESWIHDHIHDIHRMAQLLSCQCSDHIHAHDIHDDQSDHEHYCYECGQLCIHGMVQLLSCQDSDRRIHIHDRIQHHIHDIHEDLEDSCVHN